MTKPVSSVLWVLVVARFLLAFKKQSNPNTISDIIMKTLNKVFRAFWQEQSGLTIVEYALAGTLVALAAITALTGLGAAIATKITAITTAL